MLVSLALLHPLASLPAAASTCQSDSTEARTGQPRALFVENVGQFDPRVRFRIEGATGPIHLTEDGLWITVLDPSADRFPEKDATPPDDSRKGLVLHVSFPGSNPDVELHGVDPADTTVSYFTGDDPARWVHGAPVYHAVVYRDLYPGIDLEVRPDRGFWSWRLITRRPSSGISIRKPSSPTEQVRLQIDGADAVELGDSQLVITTPHGQLLLPLLELTGPDTGGTAPGPRMIGTDQVQSPMFAAAKAPKETEEEKCEGWMTAYGEELTAAGRPLTYSYLVGGGQDERVRAIALDPETGAIYLTGYTNSDDIPEAVGDFAGGSFDAYVAQLVPTGDPLITYHLGFVTYLGGDGFDLGSDLAVDPIGGGVFVVGQTDSSVFPSTDEPFTGSHRGLEDIFIARVDRSGNRTYAQILAGEGIDVPYSIRRHPSLARLYLTGFTTSEDFPRTLNPLDDTLAGGQEAFLVALVPGESNLVYSTFLGGGWPDQGHDLEFDTTGETLFLTGQTESADFFDDLPIPAAAGSFDTDFGAQWDGFLLRLDSDDFTISYRTFIGGDGLDCETPGNLRECQVAFVSDDSVYVAGVTSSTDFPTTPGVYDPDRDEPGPPGTGGPGLDAFVAKFDTSEDGPASLVFSTLISGGEDDRVLGLGLGTRREPIVVGRTDSCDFPLSSAPLRDRFEGQSDAFLAKLDAHGRSLLYSTYLGGSGIDGANDIVVDPDGVAHVVGRTTSGEFPSHRYPYSLRGATDAFVLGLRTPNQPQFQVQLFELDSNEPGKGPPDRGVSHLFWPFVDSSYASPCASQNWLAYSGCSESGDASQYELACWSFAPGSDCHRREDCYAQDWHRCCGTELSCPSYAGNVLTAGQPFLSPIDGRVIHTSHSASWGTQVIIQVFNQGRPSNFAVRILHFQEGSVVVGTGDLVARGDLLARVGRTGDATDWEHAHIALYRNLDGAALERLSLGQGLHGGLLCDSTVASPHAAEYRLDAVRSNYFVEYRFEGRCDLTDATVENTGGRYASDRDGSLLLQGGPISDFARLEPRGVGHALLLGGRTYITVDNTDRAAFRYGVGVAADLSMAPDNQNIEKAIASQGDAWRLVLRPDARVWFEIALVGNETVAFEFYLPDSSHISDPPGDSWAQLAAVYDRKLGPSLYWNGEPVIGVDTYVNGQLVEELPRRLWGRMVIQGSEPIRIGSAADGTPWFSGLIDNVRVWIPLESVEFD